MNYSRYARQLELKKFSPINEQFVIEEKPANEQQTDPQQFIKAVLDAKPNSGSPYEQTYSAFWKELVSTIVGFVDKGIYENQFVLDNGWAYRWKVDKDGKVTITYIGKTDLNLESLADKFGEALANGIGEDEDTVFELFRDDIQSENEFNEFKQYWDSQGFEYLSRGRNAFGGNQWNDIVKPNKHGKPQEKYTSLDAWIDRYFNENEKGRLNDVIARYTDYRFK